MRSSSRLVAVGAASLVAGLVAVPTATAADTRPPTSPSNVRVLATSPSTVTISFTGSTDNVGLRWYSVQVGNRQQPTTSPSRTEIGGLVSNTTYSLTVVAIDRAGNVSAPSQPVTFTTPGWAAPSGLRVTSTAGNTVGLAWNRSTDMDPYRFLVYDNGRGEVATKGEQVTVRNLTGGSHTLTVRAMHSSGDVSPPSASVTVTVPSTSDDRTPPTPPGNPMIREEEDAYAFITTWTASTDDVDPPSSLTYELLQLWAGELFVVRYGITGTSTSGPFATAVRAVDRAGNRSAPAFTTSVW
jgi:predicted phage tail protein